MDMIMSGLFGTTIASIFTYCILSAFLISIIFCCIRRDNWRSILSKASALLTTIGLFGTFCGVAVGLGYFDSSNIDASVIKLLDGMKLAFWTSILGMLCALVFNLFQFIVDSLVKNTVSDSVDASDIYTAIRDEGSLLKELVEAIGSGRDTSLLTQLQKLRTETVDTRTELLKAFDEFTAKVTENNSKALIEALEQVIKDFNTKISEQFGDNFKQLNEAVGKLRNWQAHYANQLNSMIIQFKAAQTGIEASNNGIAQIKSNMDAIPALMSQLKSIIVSVDEELNKSKETLNGFVALRNQASEVFPTIQRSVTDLTGRLKESIESAANAFAANVSIASKQLSSNVSNVLEKLDIGITDLTDGLKDGIESATDALSVNVNTVSRQMASNIADTLKNLGEDIDATSKKLSDDIEHSAQLVLSSAAAMADSTKTQNETIKQLGTNIVDTTRTLETSLKKGMDDLQLTFKKSAEEIDKTTKKSFDILDKEMEEIHKKAIGSMGSKLASVSEKMISDHNILMGNLNNVTGNIDKLTRKLNEIASISSRSR